VTDQKITFHYSLDNCNEAKNYILKESDADSQSITVFELDLSSLESVRRFADAVKEKFDHIDVLINNAGIMAIPTREVSR
jgi:NAD(P)-dependent dehydrogenase (short-subunit alcohol dehydrogenase family)